MTMQFLPRALSPRRLVPVSATLALLVGVGATASPAGASGSSKTPDLSGITLNVGVDPGGYSTALEASGAYNGAKYKVNFAQLDGAAPLLQALTAGSTNVSEESGTSLTIANANAPMPWTTASAPFKVVAFYNPLNSKTLPAGEIVVSKDSGITKLAQLKGKKVAWTANGFLEVLALSALQKAGLEETDVQHVTIPYTSDVQALEAGEVDAVVTGFQEAQTLLTAGDKSIATSASLNVPQNSTFAVQTKSLKNPAFVAAVRDFLVRTQKGLTWETKHPQQVIQILAKANETSVATAKATYKGWLIALEPVTAAQIAIEQDKANLLFSAGTIPRKVDVSPQYVTTFSSALK